MSTLVPCPCGHVHRQEHLPDEGYQVGANEDIETNPNHLLCCEENVGCVEGEHPLQLCTPLLAVGGAVWCEGEGEGGRGREGREGDTGESKCRMGCEKCVEGGAGGDERESWSEYLVCTMAEGFRSTSSSNPTAKMSDGCSVAFNDGRRQ